MNEKFVRCIYFVGQFHFFHFTFADRWNTHNDDGLRSSRIGICVCDDYCSIFYVCLIVVITNWHWKWWHTASLKFTKYVTSYAQRCKTSVQLHDWQLWQENKEHLLVLEAKNNEWIRYRGSVNLKINRYFIWKLRDTSPCILHKFFHSIKGNHVHHGKLNQSK